MYIVLLMMKSKRLSWSEIVARTKKMNTYRILVGKPEGERPLERSGCMWEVNIKTNLREIECAWYGFDSSGSGQGLLKGSCEHGNETSDSIKFCKILE
jgi:hypothetical protein